MIVFRAVVPALNQSRKVGGGSAFLITDLTLGNRNNVLAHIAGQLHLQKPAIIHPGHEGGAGIILGYQRKRRQNSQKKKDGHCQKRQKSQRSFVQLASPPFL